MPAIYRWEHQQFPWQYAIEIKPSLRIDLTQALARAYGFTKGSIPVRLNTRGGGRAHLGTWGCSIDLPGPKYECPLGLIVHELAHVYDWVAFKHQGHDKTFKKSLIKLMVEVRTMKMLPPILEKLRKEQSYATTMWQKRILADQERSRRAAAAREEAQSPRGRLERAQEAAKRLRTRAKRLATALRKAEGRVRRLEGVVARQNGARSAPNYPISRLLPHSGGGARPVVLPEAAEHPQGDARPVPGVLQQPGGEGVPA